MSHVTEFTDVVITNIEALQLAIETYCPLVELVPGKDYRTWATENDGKLVGDYAPPAGMTEAEIGHNAAYVIRATDAALEKLPCRGNRTEDYVSPYEIGVVPSKTAPGQYSLVFDFWEQGRGLLKLPGLGEHNEKTGKALDDLYMYYRMAEDALAARAVGDSIEFTKVGDHWESKVDTVARLGY
jgi:hypothetical protein